MTQFCGVHVQVTKGIWLFLDGNSKITRDNGTYAEPVPNAFSLPHISSCPGSTDACRESCYVHGLQANVPETYQEYVRNSAAIHRILMSPYSMNRSAITLGNWITQNVSSFRWHVSGDVFSHRYAQWIVYVCKGSPDVSHWIYTRSFEVVPELLKAKNLTVNLSGDRDNWDRALACYETHRDTMNPQNGPLRLTYLTKDDMIPEEAQIIFPDYPLRGRGLANPTEHPFWQSLSDLPGNPKTKVCPADFFGQSEQHRCGPCTKCL